MPHYPKINSARVTAEVHLPEILVGLTRAGLENRDYLRSEYLSEARYAVGEIVRSIDEAIQADKKPTLKAVGE